MVSDRIIDYITSIINKTKQHKIKWRPLREILEANRYNEHYSDLVFLSQNEFTKIYWDDSFYARKDGETLILVTSEWESGKDGSISIHKELKCLSNDFSNIVNVPEYNNIPYDELLVAIKDYWEHKCMDYNQDISDIFDVLNNFAEDD